MADLSSMIFLWSERNEQHIAAHVVSPGEAAYVVRRATNPFPQDVGDGKKSVWGRTGEGRLLQVLFVYAPIEDVEPDEYARLQLHERIALEEGEQAVRVIHARD